ncbi:MAG: hypothetical protein SFY70_12905 [Bacteroidia bacterium]|nr:hypothetical protein [Bacteroidia bacterium]
MKPPVPLPTDPLEVFVRRNRAAFDTESPQPDLWLRIAAELDAAAPAHNVRQMPAAARRTLRPALWQAAATITLLAGFFLLLGRPAPQSGAQASTETTNLGSFSEELAQADAYFSRAISRKKDEIVALAKYEPNLVKDFLKDLDELDATYGRLRNELPQSANPDAVVAAMIQNLQLRLEVLGRQLEILQQIQARMPNPTPGTPRQLEPTETKPTNIRL